MYSEEASKVTDSGIWNKFQLGVKSPTEWLNAIHCKTFKSK